MEAHDPATTLSRPLGDNLARLLTLGVVALCAGVPPAAAAQEPGGDLTQIGFEALVNMEVTSVSKRPEKWSEAGVAVYVITQEDIRRSAATSIPEALRLAPGVQVSRIDANKWSIGVRGFASRLSRSLLVLIDGRTVYSPLFAGVYWEVQDVLLEDIERIEVIRGPGGSLWGANAVNGVVNVITKQAAATQGALATLGGGAEERGFTTFRLGRAPHDGFAYRLYGKVFDRDGGFHEGAGEFDDWWMGRAGVRAEWTPRAGEEIVLEAEGYDGRSGQRSSFSTYSAPFTQVAIEDAELSGGHLRGRWKRTAAQGSIMNLRFYYDRTHRREPSFGEDRDTFDLDFQQHLTSLHRHEIVWGAGYRVTADDTSAVPTIEFSPASRTDHLASAFIQDEIALVPGRLRLTLGSKFEHNDYSGFEAQPSLRMAWTPTPGHVLWGMASRAVRTPSRIEHDLFLTSLIEPTTPTFARLIGDEEFVPETLQAFEVGYRGELSHSVLLDVAAFVNDYEDLLSIESGTPFAEASPAPAHTVVPLFLRNKMAGRTYGVEIAPEWRALDWWHIGAAYSYLRIDLTPDPDSLDAGTEASAEGSSPRHQAYLRSSMNLPLGVELDSFLRYTDELASQGVDSYFELDTAVHWPARPGLRLSLVGRNLLHRRHLEFGGGSPVRTLAERAIFLKAAVRW